MIFDVLRSASSFEFEIHFLGLTELLHSMLADVGMQCGAMRLDCVEAPAAKKNSFESEIIEMNCVFSLFVD